MWRGLDFIFVGEFLIENFEKMPHFRSQLNYLLVKKPPNLVANVGRLYLQYVRILPNLAGSANKKFRRQRYFWIYHENISNVWQFRTIFGLFFNKLI